MAEMATSNEVLIVSLAISVSEIGPFIAITVCDLLELKYVFLGELFLSIQNI